MKKKVIIVSIIIIVLVIVGGWIIGSSKKSNQDTRMEITIGIYDKENTNVYNKEIKTEKLYLIDVLKDTEDLNVITENTEYGEFITSIMDIEQGNNFYWSYYIDDEYATVGVSSCQIENGKTYNFKIEKFEQ